MLILDLVMVCGLAQRHFNVYISVEFGFRSLCKLSYRQNGGRAQACFLLDPVSLKAVVEGCPLCGLKETGAGPSVCVYV